MHTGPSEASILRSLLNKEIQDHAALVDAVRDAIEMLRRPKNQHSNGEAAATLLERALTKS